MSNLLSSFSSMIKPKDMEFVEAKNLSFGQLQHGNIPLNITVVFKNPNNLSIHLESIVFDLYCWNSQIGSCNQSPEMEIVANNTFELSLSIVINASELKEKLKSDFLNILTDGSIAIPVQVKGKAGIKKFGFCLDIPVDVTKEIKLTLEQLLEKIKM